MREPPLEKVQSKLVMSVEHDDEPGFYDDITPSLPFAFRYENGQYADQFTILEALGGGVCLIDFDRDGRMDVFALGGGSFVGPDKREIVGRPSGLFRNLGDWAFEDVSSGTLDAHATSYTHGGSVTDYDRDGWPDIVVTGWGGLALLHNEEGPDGERIFVERTSESGLTDNRWSSSAAWGDLDADGDPDLYVCRYVDWSFENHPRCRGYSFNVPRDICRPQEFRGLRDSIYRNEGGGVFRDVTDCVGLKNGGKGLGVVIVDVNDDRKPDIYVANDTEDNFLYLNQTDGNDWEFVEVGLSSGVARDDLGNPNGSMGVAAGDYDGTGRPALWVTNYARELHGLYRNEGNSVFSFCTKSSRIVSIGNRFVGFGSSFLDFDNDGWLDLAITNGHAVRYPNDIPFAQKPVLLHNSGDGTFVDVTSEGGPYFRADHMGRGLAVGDLDNDGWADIVISHSPVSSLVLGLNEPITFLRNRVTDDGVKNHWLGFQLDGRNHEDLVGAKLIVVYDERVQTYFVSGGGSYCSSGDQRILVGLGKADSIDSVEVVWPSGEGQRWQGSQFEVDQYYHLTWGNPRADSSP